MSLLGSGLPSGLQRSLLDARVRQGRRPTRCYERALERRLMFSNMRIEALERRVAALEAHRCPGRAEPRAPGLVVGP